MCAIPVALKISVGINNSNPNDHLMCSFSLIVFNAASCLYMHCLLGYAQLNVFIFLIHLGYFIFSTGYNGFQPP